MPKTFGEVRRRLREEGFVVARQSGSHRAWRHPDGRRVTVAGKDFKTVPVGTLTSIRRAAGVGRPPMRWTVIYGRDPASGDWAARAADLPVYVGGNTREEVERLIGDAIALHLASLRDEGLPLPTPRSTAGDVEVAA